MCPDNTQKKMKIKICALELTLSVYLNNDKTQLFKKSVNPLSTVCFWYPRLLHYKFVFAFVWDYPPMVSEPHARIQLSIDYAISLNTGSLTTSSMHSSQESRIHIAWVADGYPASTQPWFSHIFLCVVHGQRRSKHPVVEQDPVSAQKLGWGARHACHVPGLQAY